MHGQAIDLTLVRRDRQFPYEDPEDKRLGRRPLRHLISEVYTAKGALATCPGPLRSPCGLF